MMWVTLLLPTGVALVVLLALLVWLAVTARRAADAVAAARSALDENAGMLSARAAALRVELQQRRGDQGDEPGGPTA